ncbi:hypothetical protein [Halovenus marina]|uniref:hypothetical protein n=1 Tax=Halovenus marina TaxID=3396621 RepID=UPI003F55C91C
MTLLTLTRVLAHPATTNGFDIDIDIATGLGGGAVGSFLTTFLVGAILIAIAPAYVERMLDEISEEPVESFAYGIAALLGLVVLTIALVLTILGILLVIPLIVLAVVVWAIGSVIAFLAIGERLLDADSADDWLKPLAVGAAINGGLALTGIGGLVSFCIGAAGFGVILRDRLSG